MGALAVVNDTVERCVKDIQDLANAAHHQLMMVITVEILFMCLGPIVSNSHHFLRMRWRNNCEF